MRELAIQPKTEGKGRTFQASLISYVLADNLWSGGAAGTDNIRPVWMMFAASDNELRPFIANLQLGRKAEVVGNGWRRQTARFEILKSAGFQTSWQRTALGSVVTMFAPDLFRLDPGMVDPKGVEFVVLPDAAWLAAVQVDPKARDYITALQVPVEEDRLDILLRMAPLFIGYLDRRTRCPLVPDQRFYVQVLCAALQEGLASWSVDPDRFSYDHREWGLHKSLGFWEADTEVVGLAPGVAFKAGHDRLETFLAEQVKFYFARVKD